MTFINDVNRVSSDNIKRIQRLDPRRIVGMSRVGIRFKSYLIIYGPTEVPENSGAQYECRMHYTDGSSHLVDADSWSVTSSYATIDSTGYLITTEVPSINVPIIITAEYDGMETTMPVSIQDVVKLTSIEISGPTIVNERDGAQYTCMAYYDNGSNAPCTPAWSENSPHASINVGGYLSTGEVPNADQPCEITADFGGKQDQILVQIRNIVIITHVIVTGPSNVEERDGAQYTCMAYYDDGAIVDRTSLADWSENSIYATINSTGYLTTLETPNSDEPCLITASYEGKSDNHLIQIDNVVLITHIIIEGPLTVDEVGGAQYNCRAYYDDGTNTLVTPVWSEDSVYASINVSGYLTTYDVVHVNRPCTISASFDGKADDLAITITNVILLDHVTITGLSDIEEDTQEQYTCTAHYDNASTSDVTSLAIWTDNKSWASIADGLLTVGDIPTDENVTVSALYGIETDDLVVIVRTIGGAVPAGLILPFNGSTVPTNWTQFNSANNRMIIGAGSSYSIGQIGGTAVGGSIGNLGGSTGDGGNHADSPHIYGFYGPGYATVPLMANSQPAGTHAHTLGSVVLSNIDRNIFKLIKSNVTQDNLPINAITISATSLASLGMTNINANNKMFSANASTTTTDKSGYVVLGAIGNHAHNYYSGGGPYGAETVDFLQEDWQGEHSGNSTLTSLTQNFKRLLLSLWTNASADFEPGMGMIGMWESLTPPDGWLICDGTNGTPDLRNNFIQNCASGVENITSQGTNQVTCGLIGNISHDAVHTHYSGYWQSWAPALRSFVSASHGAITWNHSHSVNRSLTLSFLPSYYALIFIMRGPELDYIEVTGDTEVIKNAGAQYTATAYFVGGLTVDVTALSDWFEDSPYASIDSSGYLTTGDVTQTEDVNVEAIYDVKRNTLPVQILNAEIPQGLIVFSNGASTPSGWSAFSSANDRMIIGAGSTYAPATNGGSNYVTTYTGASSSAGGHTNGSLDDQFDNLPSGYDFPQVLASAGHHSHNAAGAVYVPPKNKLKLIKANSAQVEFPIDSVLIGQASMSGLTNILTDNKYLSVGSSTGVINESSYASYSSAGTHNHTNTQINRYGQPPHYCHEWDANVGNHGLSHAISITANIKNVLLSLWTHASAQIAVASNMIAMWEGVIAPSGWTLCDGTNGTPDLRDCFIRSTSTGNENITPTGNNTASVPAFSTTVTHSTTHDHITSSFGIGNTYSTQTFYHPQRTISHSHSISQSARNGVAWVPPYYSLSFIMKLT